MTADDWTEKYRPRSLSQVLGSDTAVSTMISWAKEWQSGRIPEKRAIAITGPPGVGKTSAAEALANDFGWSIIELNASEARNADVLKKAALRSSQFSSFGADGSFMDASEGRMNLIVLDEADSINGNIDRGAGPVITELVKTTRQPVMILANDSYVLNKKLSVLKENAINITFKSTRAQTVAKIIRRICASEGITIDDDAVERIAENADGDIRASIRDLQTVATGKTHVTLADTEVLSGRENRSDVRGVVSAIYRHRDPELAAQRYRAADTDPGMLLLWLQENMPYECADTGDLVRVSGRLQMADLYLARVSKRMTYGFWSYALDEMLRGVPASMRSPSKANSMLRFPMYLSRMSRAKSVRAIRASAGQKVGALMHTSASRVNQDLLPQLRMMLTEDAELRQSMVKDAHLEPEELAYLLGVDADRKIVKDCYAAPKPAKEPAKKKKPKDEPPEEPPPAEPKAPPAGQKSFADFM